MSHRMYTDHDHPSKSDHFEYCQNLHENDRIKSIQTIATLLAKCTSLFVLVFTNSLCDTSLIWYNLKYITLLLLHLENSTLTLQIKTNRDALSVMAPTSMVKIMAWRHTGHGQSHSRYKAARIAVIHITSQTLLGNHNDPPWLSSEYISYIHNTQIIICWGWNTKPGTYINIHITSNNTSYLWTLCGWKTDNN